jgi:hypothetical protein
MRRTAGSDTTANSTAAILFHILKNPRVYRALREELGELVEDAGLEAGEDGLALPSHDQVRCSRAWLGLAWADGRDMRLLLGEEFEVPAGDYRGGAADVRDQRVWTA